MKRSHAAVLSAVGLAFALMLAVAFSIRVTTPESEALPTLSGQRAERTFDLRGFTGVDLRGQWQVTIVRSDSWAVELSYPAELEQFLDVRTDGDSLVLGYRATRGWWSDFGADERLAMIARIAMPALARAELSGASSLDISGFEGRRLEINVSGASSIDGKDSRYQELDLTMSGAGKLDFGGVTTVDAHVQLSGAQTVTLRMAGGSLTGTLSGATTLEYFGDVSAQRVNSSGFSNVRQRN